MKQAGKVVRWLADFIEVHLPIGVFVMMFLVFLVNVVFRYVFRNPQNWTFELSVNSFVVVGLLGACAAYRKEDHVVFDLLYTRLKERGKNILRIVSHIVVIALFIAALPSSLKYLIKLPVVTSIMRIPLRIIFSSFAIMMISMIIRSIRRLVLDVKTFRNKTYTQSYNVEEGDELI